MNPVTPEQTELTIGDKLLVSFFKTMTPKMAGELETRLIELLSSEQAWKEKYEHLHHDANLLLDRHVEEKGKLREQFNQAVEALEWYAEEGNYSAVIAVSDGTKTVKGIRCLNKVENIIVHDNGKRARDFLSSLFPKEGENNA